MGKLTKKFRYFPEITNPKFSKIINKKKEFYINRQRDYDEQIKLYEQNKLHDQNKSHKHKSHEHISHEQNKSKSGKGDDGNEAILNFYCKKSGDGKFELLPQQKVLKNFISPYTNYNKVLVMHGTGSGKTFSGISIAEYHKNFLMYLYHQRETNKNYTNFTGRIYIVANREARDNFIDELIEKTGYTYISQKEKEDYLNIKREHGQKTLEIYKNKRKKIIRKLTQKDQGGFYKFMSYDEFRKTFLKISIFDEKQNKDKLNKEKLNEGGKNKSNISEGINKNGINKSDINEKDISEDISEDGISEEDISEKGMNESDISEDGISEDGINEENISDEDISESNINEEELNKNKGDYGLGSVIPIDNSIIIVDEAHNLVNSQKSNDYGEAIRKVCSESKNVKLILMTATPMTHTPKEIIEISNILNFDLPKSNYNDFFGSNKINNDHINKMFYGKISYFRGYNVYTYPKRIEMGTLWPCKVTKLVRCQMTGIQRSTYLGVIEQSKNEKLQIDELNLLNLVFPNPGIDGKRNGLYRNYDLQILMNAPKKFLLDNNIYFYKRPNGDNQITGDFLKINNIGKYSRKYYKFLEEVNSEILENSGHIFIYSKLVNGTGTRLLREIFLQNGYSEFTYNTIDTGEEQTEQTANIKCYYCGRLGNKNHPKDHKYRMAKFVIIDSSIEDRRDIKNTFDIFNSTQNKNCQLLKIIVGSGIVREAVDLKRVKYIHILMFDTNFATIEQSIGRGIRHCSHADLEPSQRFTKVYRYVSTLGPEIVTGIKKNIELSSEEKFYVKGEKNHMLIKMIERQLKIIAFDCEINKKGNVFDVEIKKNKGCERKKNCDQQCDYQDCNYKCFNANSKDNNEIDVSTFDAYYNKSQLNSLIKFIKLLFTKNIVWTKEDIIRQIKNEPTEIKYIDDFNYQYLTSNKSNEFDEFNKLRQDFELYSDQLLGTAILTLLKQEKNNIKNMYGMTGHIIQRGKYFIFQPSVIQNTKILPIARNISVYNIKETRIDITEFLNNKYFPQKEKTTKEEIMKIFNNLEKMTNESVIAKYLSSLPLNYQITLIEYAIELHNKSTIPKNENIVVKKIFTFYANALIDSSKFEGILSYIPMSKIVKSIIENKAGKSKIVGHYLGNSPVCFIKNKWGDCYYELISRQQKEKNILEVNDYIFGYIDRLQNDQFGLKLQYSDKSRKAILDKRKKLKGFVCKQHNNKDELIEIANNIGAQINKNKKMTVEILCDAIEERLRTKELEARKNKTGVKWFYEYFERKKISNKK